MQCRHRNVNYVAGKQETSDYICSRILDAFCDLSRNVPPEDWQIVFDPHTGTPYMLRAQNVTEIYEALVC